MIQGVESLGRVRTRGIVVLILAFVAGGIVGVAAERVRVVRSASERPFARGPGARPPRPGELPRFYEQLDLSRAQEDSMRAILERARPRADSLMRQTLPLLRMYRDSIQQELRSVLTEEQRVQLDREMAARGQGRGARRRPFGPGGPDPLPEPPPQPPEQP
jgi:Spy/CpxP family protein refolding chaperone